MKQFEEILNEFDFSEELKNYVNESAGYGSFPNVQDDVIVEVEQQRVVSSNNIYLST